MPRPRGKNLPVRMSVSLDATAYAELHAISSDLGVSASWVLRRALEEFIERHRSESQTELPFARSSAKTGNKD